MADTVSARVNPELSVTLTMDPALDLGDGSPATTIKTGDTATTLNASSTPPATKVASDERALVAGADALDLTAAPGRDGGTVDFTGLKVQAIKIVADAGNAGPITFAKGSSNGYELYGSSWTFDVQPGGKHVQTFEDQAPDVGAAAKAIDVSGTGTDSYKIIIVAG